MMSSTATQTLVERTTHSYKGSLYLLPSDEEECQRLLTQHHLYTHALSGRLIFPPVTLKDKDEVLDVGTGSGTWLCDTRAHLPESVQLYGVDIEARLFPKDAALLPNVHLSVASSFDLPSYWTSKFSLVHQRFMICAYSRDQWFRAISEMYRVLAPGGYIQLIETGPEWVAGPKTSSLVLFLDDFFAKRGMLLRCGVYIADILKVTGFIDVKCEEAPLNMGKWAGEEGIMGRDITIGGVVGMRGPVLKANGAGRYASAEEFDQDMKAVTDEWDNTPGSHTTARVFYGRKPL